LALEAAGPWQAVPVRLPVELHERLRHWCQANEFTMAVVLRGLVARFLDEYGAPPPKPARHSGTAAQESSKPARRSGAAAHKPADQAGT
jgi:hypothetical protein